MSDKPASIRMNTMLYTYNVSHNNVYDVLGFGKLLVISFLRIRFRFPGKIIFGDQKD